MKYFPSRMTSWYFSKSALPYWTILLLDCFAGVFSLFVAGILTGSKSIIIENPWHALATYGVFLPSYLIGFRIFHTYSGILRFSTFRDLNQVAFACLTAFVLQIAELQIFGGCTWFVHYSIFTLVVSAVMSICIMWAVRIWTKSLYDGTYKIYRNKRTFIYDANDGGVGIAKSIVNQPASPYVLAGFVTDDREMERKRLAGVRVYPRDKNLVDRMCAKDVCVLIVTSGKIDKLRNDPDLVNDLIDNKIKIMLMPKVQEWDGRGSVSALTLREVKVEDLLPRDTIEIDMKSVGAQLNESVILITGAAGSIGSEMVRQVSRFSPKSLILIDQAETPLHDVRLMMLNEFPKVNAYTIVADIRDQKRMEEIFSKARPDYVFHAAAYKHVPMMEDNPYESVENNIGGTRNIADLAVKYGTKKFVMVSTDKAVNPTNVMGCSKRICEIYVQSLDKAIKEGKVKGNTAFVTTRFGNVLGSNGSVIPLFEKQIRDGGPVTVTHPDIIRFFMLIPEACKLVLEAGTMGKGGEIFVFDMGKPVRIAELAQRMIQLSGAKDVEIKYTGLRDGEKLYEEVLNEEEITIPTFHAKIKIAKVREYDYAEASAEIGSLIQDALHDDEMGIVSKMKNIVPEFKSKHSRYEVLDK